MVEVAKATDLGAVVDVLVDQNLGPLADGKRWTPDRVDDAIHVLVARPLHCGAVGLEALLPPPGHY